MTPEDVDLINLYEKNWTSMTDHMLVIYGVTLGLRPKMVLEIGIGISTLAILLALKRRGSGKLCSIDIGPNRKSMNRVASRVRGTECGAFWDFWVADSFEFWKKWTEPLDMLFIDGDHSLKGIKNDFENYSKFVRKDGLILMHDAYVDVGTIPPEWGPVDIKLYIPEIRKRSEEFELATLPYCYGLTIVRKLV